MSTHFGPLSGADELEPFGPSWEEPAQPVSPPLWLLGAGFLELLACALVFLLGSPVGHGIGYGIGAVVLPVTVAVYRQVDRRRGRSGLYASPGGVHLIPTPMLILGVALAMTHALYLAINKRLA
jgi:hypothetical protein